MILEISSFNNLNHREPMTTEIIDNLKDKIDTHIIQKILDENKKKSGYKLELGNDMV